MEDHYEECLLIEDVVERARCLFKLLDDVTKLQDKVQISIPPLNESNRRAKSIINNANAIILDLSKFRGNIKNVLETPYVREKVNELIDNYNQMVHDYNLVKDRGFLQKLDCKPVMERASPSGRGKELEKRLFKDQEKLTK